MVGRPRLNINVKSEIVGLTTAAVAMVLMVVGSLMFPDSPSGDSTPLETEGDATA